jgi:hypothetical protein
MGSRMLTSGGRLVAGLRYSLEAVLNQKGRFQIYGSGRHINVI